MQELIARMNAVCDAQPFTTSWYVKDLVTGQEADRDGDMVLPSASTRKTSILMHALSRVHEGVLKLDEPSPLKRACRKAWIAARINICRLTASFRCAMLS